MATVTVPEQMTRPKIIDPATGNKVDNPFLEFVQLAAFRGRFPRILGRNAIYYDVPPEELPLDLIAAIAGMGGDVTGYPVWVELTEADLDQPAVPPQTNPDDTPVTWGQVAGGAITQANGKVYVGLNSHASDIAAITAAALTVKTISEMQQIVAANQPAETP